MFVNIRIDAGADMCASRNAFKRSFNFPFWKRKAQLANAAFLECEVASSVELCFKNRRTICNAMILRSNAEPLLGCNALEDMDALIHSLRPEHIVTPTTLIFRK